MLYQKSDLQMTELDFPGWLVSEIRNRGWSLAEFARQAGISASQVSRVINREHRPGPDFCQGAAAALNIPVARAFRFAGLLPSYQVKDVRDNFFEIFDTLSDDSQAELFRLARMMRVCEELEEEARDD